MDGNQKRRPHPSKEEKMSTPIFYNNSSISHKIHTV